MRKYLIIVLMLLVGYCSKSQENAVDFLALGLLSSGDLFQAEGLSTARENLEEDVKVAAGRNHTCALRNGQIKCWGSGWAGALGYGNAVGYGLNNLPSAAPIVNTGADKAKDITVGQYHTCMLTDNGKVKCWGYNAQGQLGYGHTNSLGDAPNEVPAYLPYVDFGSAPPIAEVMAQGDHTCARTTANQIYCWGENTYGELGYGHTNKLGDNPGETPAAIGPVPTGRVALQLQNGGGADTHHTCALVAGKLGWQFSFCWGRNNLGQLDTGGQLGQGQPNNIGDNELASVGSNAITLNSSLRVAAADNNTCEVGASGLNELHCWGHGHSGRNGLAHTFNIGDNEQPKGVALVNLGISPLGFFEPVDVTMGQMHSCVLSKDGFVKCWGMPIFLGQGNPQLEYIGDDEVPGVLTAINLGPAAIPVKQIAGGNSHTCAVRVDNQVICWGQNLNGQLGYGNNTFIGDDEQPIQAGFVSIF